MALLSFDPSSIPISTLLLLIASGLAISFVINTFITWNRLSHIPGPWYVGFSRYVEVKSTLTGRLGPNLKTLCDKYGSLVRIGPNHVVTSDPEILKRVWAVRSTFTRGPGYIAARFDPTRDTLLSTRDNAAHSELKAKMAAGYSGKEVDNLEGTIDNNIKALTDLIESQYLSSSTEFRPVDLALIMQYFTLDVITEVAFGKPFNYIKTNSDVHGYIKMTRDAMPFIMMVGVYPIIAKTLQSRLFRGLLPTEADNMGFGPFIGIAKQVAAERYGPDKKVRRDMLGSFVAHGLTQEEAGSEILLQIVAGSDTTATAIRATLLYIITSPTVYSSLREEIDLAIKEGKISFPISDAEARQLPYLQAMIKEGMRIFPPVQGPLMPRVVPEGGVTMDGHFIPAGTQVAASILGYQHSKAMFGEDAEMFRPERWLEEKDPDTLRLWAQTVDLVFNYGKWQCPGKNVAAIELNKVFVELLRKFDVALVDPTNPWKSYNAGVFIQTDLFVKFTKRV